MLILNEWRYLLRQPLLWVASMVVPLIAYLFAVGIGSVDSIAAKQLQSLQMTLLMMSLPLLTGALAPLILLRDQQHDMAELILACPQSTLRRLLARVLSLTLIIAVLLLVALLIIHVSLSQRISQVWPLWPLTLWNFFILVLPACVLFSTLACWINQRFISAVVSYAIFAGIWLSYMMLASMTGSPMLAGSSIVSPWLFELMRLLDPYGITAVLALYQGNEINYFGDLILYANRLFYCAVAVLLFIASVRLTPHSATSAPKTIDLTENVRKNATYQHLGVSPSMAKQLIALTHMTLCTLLKQRLNQFLLFVWLLLLFNEVMSGIDYAEPLSVLKPTSMDALNRIADDVLPLLANFLALFWAWQLCWRNRQTGMAELIAASPVRSGILVISQTIALVCLIALLLILTALSASAAEWFANSQWQPGHYVKQLALAGLPIVLLGSIFIALHTLCRSALIAGAWCIAMLAMKYTPLSGHLGLTHTLWNIAGSPLQLPDAFWGFAQSLSVYWPFMSFWLVFTLCVLCIAAGASHRGTGLNNVKRWQLSPAAAMLLTLTVYMGVNLHNHIIRERPLLNSDMRVAWRANYEKHYGHWATLAQPVISDIDSTVDIFPHAGKADFTVRYTLENRSAQPINSLLIGQDSTTSLDHISLSVAFDSEFDPQLHQTVIQLASPLLAGDKIVFSAHFRFQQPSHWPAVMHQMIKPSFSYLRGMPLLPTIGFQTAYTLRDEHLRQQYQLPPLSQPSPSVLFAQPESVNSAYEFVHMHSVVSTSAEQMPLAQGQLLKSWQQNGRRYAEYQTRQAIRNSAVWYSLNTSVLSRQYEDVLLNVFAPELNAAAELNMQAMSDTLDWMSSHIAPYRGSALNLIAMPDIGSTGYALPQMLMISHRVGFRARPAAEAGFDQRYRRAVHETAHQWFGHDIGNGVVQDSAFLVESMAKYVELVLIEQRYGPEAMQALVDYERQRYQRALRASTLQTQALVDGTESHDLYSRATLVFARLRAELGDELITQALRDIWQRHAYPLTPATSMDFVRALKALLKPQQQALVHSLLLEPDSGGLLLEQPQ